MVYIHNFTHFTEKIKYTIQMHSDEWEHKTFQSKYKTSIFTLVCDNIANFYVYFTLRKISFNSYHYTDTCIKYSTFSYEYEHRPIPPASPLLPTLKRS